MLLAYASTFVGLGFPRNWYEVADLKNCEYLPILILTPLVSRKPEGFALGRTGEAIDCIAIARFVVPFLLRSEWQWSKR